MQQVKDAFESTKPGKAAGVDDVCPELLTELTWKTPQVG